MRLILTLLALSSACSSTPDTAETIDANTSPHDGGAHDASDVDATVDASTSSDAGVDGGDSLDVQVLDDVTLTNGTHYQLLRLQRGDSPASYAQWYPPALGVLPRPVVVVTKPYDGIDWTGDALDQRWAALGEGLHPDVDSPNAGANPGVISYKLAPADMTDDSSLFRLHNMGALLIYGRFYAGGDVQNDIDDMTTGLDFLATSPFVDRERIGIWGGSWGGFEAVYGAAYADASVRPSVGAALAPLTDFEREVAFVTTDLPSLYTEQPNRDAAATFFAPYLRRIDATRSAHGSYSGLRAADIAERIEIPFLLIHDDWDTLVSFDQSTALAALDPQSFQPLWLLHAGPPSPWDTHVNTHGPLLAQFTNSELTFLLTFLLTHLAYPDQTITSLWDDANMRALSLLMLDRQREGKDVDFYAARLRELTDARVTLRSWTDTTTTPGADKVAAEVNAVWNTTFDATTIGNALATGLPPAP